MLEIVLIGNCLDFPGLPSPRPRFLGPSVFVYLSAVGPFSGMSGTRRNLKIAVRSKNCRRTGEEEDGSLVSGPLKSISPHYSDIVPKRRPRPLSRFRLRTFALLKKRTDVKMALYLVGSTSLGKGPSGRSRAFLTPL